MNKFESVTYYKMLLTYKNKHKKYINNGTKYMSTTLQQLSEMEFKKELQNNYAQVYYKITKDYPEYAKQFYSLYVLLFREYYINQQDQNTPHETRMAYFKDIYFESIYSFLKQSQFFNISNDEH